MENESLLTTMKKIKEWIKEEKEKESLEEKWERYEEENRKEEPYGGHADQPEKRPYDSWRQRYPDVF